MVNQNMLDIIKTLKNNYNKNGTVIIKPYHKLNPINDKDLEILEVSCEKVAKEFIRIGDAGEKNYLHVGRFMTDIKKPKIVDNPYSKRLLKVLNQIKFINLFKKVLNIKISSKIFLRRVQFNQIDKGNFVGYHLDTDSNPDYIAAVVIQLGKNYTGGKYRVYQKNGKYIDYTPKYRSIILSNCTYPHEVTKVKSGKRQSLVFFISNHKLYNRRKN